MHAAQPLKHSSHSFSLGRCRSSSSSALEGQGKSIVLNGDGAGRQPAYFGFFSLIPFVLLWIIFGVCCLVFSMDWTCVTAAYVITQVVTTIGYGDHVPITKGGKVFVTMYALVTVLILGSFLTELSSVLVQNYVAQIGRVRDRVFRTKADRLLGEHRANNVYGVNTSNNFGKMYRVWTGFFLFAIFVGFGTLFYATVEWCTCSYGIDRIAGCVQSDCVATGGVSKTWVDCVYLSIITLTTLGLGEIVPHSKLGRIVFVPWALLGTIAMANFASSLGDALRMFRVERRSLEHMSSEIFDEIEKERYGVLSKSEFRSYALLKFGLVKKGELEMIDNLFAKMDVHKDGLLTYTRIERYFDSSGRF